MSNTDQHSKVTLDDLLRLKRTERPDAEFWANFEQELRQKQLTALVKKRRLWHELPMLLNRKFYMPAGAAAIVAFTLVTVRYSNTAPIAGDATVAPQVIAQTSPVEMLAAIEVAETAQTQPRRFEEPIARSLAPEAASLASVGAAQKIASEARTSAPQMPSSREENSEATSPRFANFVSLDTTESEPMNAILGGRLSSTAHVQKAAAVQSDVAEISSSGAAGKYRLIARYAESSLSPEPMAPALVRERLARRLGDDLGDSISRIGVVGSRVSLKF